MSYLESHLILHRLDDPVRILYWTVDEAALALLAPFIGSALDQPWLGVLVSVVGTASLIKLKKCFGGGTLKHALYWYFPHNSTQLKATPPSAIREYVG